MHKLYLKKPKLDDYILLFLSEEALFPYAEYIFFQGDSTMPSVNVRLSLPEDNPCELFHTDTKLYPYQLRQWKYQQQPIAEHPAIARWMQAPADQHHRCGDSADEQHLKSFGCSLLIAGEVGAEGLQRVVGNHGVGRQ